jgi:hypothetical protein
VRTSLRNDLLLNVNSTTGAFYFGNITTLLQLIEKFGENQPVNLIHNFINKFYVKTTLREASQKFIREAKKETTSAREKGYTVTGLPTGYARPTPQKLTSRSRTTETTRAKSLS